ncbi:hypothetical protein FIBSPDRAFT_873907 [Athelia psychrophila]|uniref:Uncharacterized protein n=1 Tax=Athelia psychrophila TaxID=1759441 RepID=A0A165Y0U8_9AGAM|nr:hypothetical protein FIBSPDRAFT_878668 [Fibularhizoctonia sp. CBS 109695]KZP09091.1 hypothetical protein FIBSPDRAFT_873907 [Fibularhizoctonia sp. CBS 109695]
MGTVCEGVAEPTAMAARSGKVRGLFTAPLCPWPPLNLNDRRQQAAILSHNPGPFVALAPAAAPSPSTQRQLSSPWF